MNKQSCSLFFFATQMSLFLWLNPRGRIKVDCKDKNLPLQTGFIPFSSFQDRLRTDLTHCSSVLSSLSTQTLGNALCWALRYPHLPPFFNGWDFNKQAKMLTMSLKPSVHENDMFSAVLSVGLPVLDLGLRCSIFHVILGSHFILSFPF